MSERTVECKDEVHRQVQVETSAVAIPSREFQHRLKKKNLIMLDVMGQGLTTH